MYELPFKEDFLLELQNNNYSLETVYNYRRDLTVFEVFMNIRGVDFPALNKRVLTFYKGFLRSPDYLKQVIEYWERAKPALEEHEYRGVGPVLDSFSIQHSDREANQSLAPKSVNRMLSAFRTYLKYLAEFDLIEKMPLTSDAVKLIKVEKKKSQVADLDELIKLMEYPSTYEQDPLIASRNRAVLELLFSSGLRISELVRLNKHDLNGQGKVYIQGKGKKQRFIYITPRARSYVNEYLALRTDANEALFAPTRGGRNGQKGKRLSPNYIQERIAHYRKMLGIVVPTSAHSFRHGFATYLAEEGASPAAIQILLGHESLHTTDRYVHASDKFAEDSHKRFHPLYNKGH
ncbi:MAG: tyrosine-type recombinase/integrase [Candidatus Dojkabacteria bacterium]